MHGRCPMPRAATRPCRFDPTSRSFTGAWRLVNLRASGPGVEDPVLRCCVVLALRVAREVR